MGARATARRKEASVSTGPALRPASDVGIAYKTILVHVEAGDDAAERLRFAVELVQQFKGWLIGLCARSLETWPDPIGISQRALRAAVESETREGEALFRRETRALGERAVWLAAGDAPTSAMAKHAFSADLVIPNRPSATAPDQTIAQVRELALRVGAPVLWIPSGLKHIQARQIVIGWKNTNTTCRAVWNSLPFLKRAHAVEVVRIVTGREMLSAGRELNQLVERLRRHWIKADGHLQLRHMPSEADELIRFAKAVAADLIVTGIQTRHPLMRWVLGGVTDELLLRSPKPVLLSG